MADQRAWDKFKSVNGHRKRPILIAAGVLAGAWLLAIAGHTLARNFKMTAAKVRAYTQSVDLVRLSGESRAKAIRGLADRLNQLTPEERRRVRMEGIWRDWFEQMNEEEKGGFIEATMPAGFKQALTSFEQLPEERRRMAIDEALKRLTETQERRHQEDAARPDGEPGGSPVLSEELQQKITKIGLKTFYSESSAQTKAEVAPLLEELQRMMESGRLFRGGR